MQTHPPSDEVVGAEEDGVSASCSDSSPTRRAASGSNLESGWASERDGLVVKNTFINFRAEPSINFRRRSFSCTATCGSLTKCGDFLSDDEQQPERELSEGATPEVQRHHRAVSPALGDGVESDDEGCRAATNKSTSSGTGSFCRVRTATSETMFEYDRYKSVFPSTPEHLPRPRTDTAHGAGRSRPPQTAARECQELELCKVLSFHGESPATPQHGYPVGGYSSSSRVVPPMCPAPSTMPMAYESQDLSQDRSPQRLQPTPKGVAAVAIQSMTAPFLVHVSAPPICHGLMPGNASNIVDGARAEDTLDSAINRVHPAGAHRTCSKQMASIIRAQTESPKRRTGDFLVVPHMQPRGWHVGQHAVEASSPSSRVSEAATEELSTVASSPCRPSSPSTLSLASHLTPQATLQGCCGDSIVSVTAVEESATPTSLSLSDALMMSEPSSSLSSSANSAPPTCKREAPRDVTRLFDALDATNNAAGGSGGSTFMLQNLNKQYTQETLLADLQAAGYGAPRIDFLYLPFHFGNKTCQGYAFVNFVDPLIAGTFVGCYSSRPFGRFDSVLRILLAEKQGRKANVARLRRSCLKITNTRFLPLVLEGSDLVPLRLKRNAQR